MAQALSWESFAELVAQAGGVPVDKVTQEARLLEDLNLDSFALTEVLVSLLLDLEMRSLERDLNRREWRQVTVGELYTEYVRNEAPPRGDQYVIRTRPRA